MEILPSDYTTREMHGILLSSVVPRPIAFATTIDKGGNVNLAPFSYFNLFSTNPPTMVFSPSRKGRDNTTKDTYENVLDVPDVTVNIVTYDIAEQMAITSDEFEPGINEYEKAGLTEVPGVLVSTPRVKESPIAFEGKVKNVQPLGDGPGAGVLVISEIVMIHIDDEIINKETLKVDPQKLKAVGRMGGSSYVRAFGDVIYDITRPTPPAIGFDALPKEIRESKFLTGADLARLAGVNKIPAKDEIEAYHKSDEFLKLGVDINERQTRHLTARKYIHSDDIMTAWKILLV